MPTRTLAEPSETRESVTPPGSLPSSPPAERTATTATHRSATNAAPQSTDTTDSATSKDCDTTDPSDTADANRVPRPQQSTPTRRSQPGAQRPKRTRAGSHTTRAALTVTAPIPVSSSSRQQPPTSDDTRDTDDPPTAGTDEPGRGDYAYHLARVCARFPTTISPEGARRLARLLRPPAAE